jgi:hypothetical protein
MSLTALESAGVSLLEHLFSIGASLVSANNPEFAPLIQLAASGVNAELANVASGTPTVLSAVENIAPGALAVTAGIVAKNNPKDAAGISQALSAIVSAIPTAPAAPAAQAPAAGS